jgi:hypothetical protein
MLVNIIQNTISSFRSALAAAEVITTNLKMWLGFETSSIDGDKQITPDKSGNNNVGELFTGKALEFDGVDDYVDVDGFQMTGTNATFAFWFNSNDTLGRFFDTVKDLSDNRLILSFNNNQISILDHTLSWFNFGSVTTNVWNRCVITIKGTTAKCFVNGVQLGVDKTISTIDLSLNTDAAIGSHVFGTQSYFDGILSDFQIYDKVWFNDDVTYDYANPNKLAIDNPSTNLVVTNLKAYWAMSEGDGLVAYDSGTNLEEDEVVNGYFATDSDWNKNSNWSISGGVAIADGTTNGDINQGTTLATIGNSYSITYEVVSISQGSFFFKFGGVSGAFRDKIGIYTEVIQAINTNRIALDSYNNAIGSVTNISVREVTASDHGGLINGADYVDAKPRIPQLGMQNWSKGSNLLPYSEDFSQSVWTKNNLTQTYGFTSPTGLLNATKLIRTSSNSYIESIINITTVQYNTASIYVKGVSNTIGEDVRLYVYNGTSLSSEVFTLTGDWQRITHTNSSASGQSSMKIKLDIPNVTNGEILVWAAQLEQSSSASAYRLTDGAVTTNSTVIPNPTIPTKDIFGNAVRDRLNSFNLDGSGYAEVADDDDLDFGTGDFTLECWAKYDFLNQGSGFNVLVSNGSMSSSGSGLSLGSSITKFEVRLNAGTAITKSFGTDDMTVGNWYHLVVTREGTSLKTYRDTTIKSSSTIASVNVDTSLPVRIGRDTTTTRFYQNLISDVRLYDRALSSTEVENNYNAGLSAHTN